MYSRLRSILSWRYHNKAKWVVSLLRGKDIIVSYTMLPDLPRLDMGEMGGYYVHRWGKDA